MRALVLALALAGCVDPDPPRLRTLVTVVATQAGQPAEDATTQLVAEGRRALVVIEAALHMADPAGRRRLLRAIERLHDPDGCPLVAHVAKFDEDAPTRAVANEVLTRWGTDAIPRATSDATRDDQNRCVPVGG